MSGSEEDVIEGVGNEEAVRVFVRIRPLNKREKDEKQTIGWNFNETSMLEDTQNGQRVYAYDHCFGMDSTNSETYEIVGKPIVLKAMEGYNGTVFTYGQTGSGKTWTMRGCAEDPGMMVLCIRDILDWVKSHPQTKYTLRVAYLEVYNEEINDLLGEVGPASKNLKIVSEDAAKGAVIGGLVEEIVKTAEDFMAVVTRGESSRSYASTNMNAESSRSHTIYRVSIEQSDKDDEPEDNSSFRSNKPVEPTGRVSYMNLVDLAGSERQKSTKAEGKVLKEGSNINKSLLALGAVINKLGEASKAPKKGAKPVFVPYRDSKLTRILKQSLGGNTLTSILCAVTPAPMHREETVSTLKFGQLCKSIKNQVKSNEFASEKDQIKQFKSTIEELRKQLEEYASGGLGLAAHVDPDTALGNALREKSELENKVRSLENMVMRGGSPGGIAFGGGSHDSEEVARLNDKLAEQNQIIERLQAHFDEHADLEEQRAHIEEYERQSRDEILEEATKLEREKDNLKTERSAFIRERSKNDDKESRIGSLITQLDEKESKLRQMLGTMKEQQEQWQRSVTDLQRREDLVDDWQSSHRQREKRLQEVDVHQEKKYQELNRREGEIVEEESRLKSAHLQLQEREQRLQVAQSRVANQEQQLQAYEEKLTGMENALKKKEGDGDIRDRELLSRRKEMESWDMLLKEKNRKIDVEQRTLDEREALIRSAEEKARLRDADAERRLVDLRQSEAAADEQMELYAQKHNEALERNRESQERDAASKALREELVHKESELKAWEKRLGKMQERLSGIEKREADLHSRVEQHKAVEDDFFNVKVAQITARHRSELKGLQTLVQDQIKIVADAQSDRKAARSEVEKKNELIAEYEAAMEQHNVIVDELREKLRLYEEGGAVLPSGDVSNNAAASGAASGGRRASSVDHNINDSVSDHGGNVGSPKSRSNSLRKTPTIDMNDPNYQNSGTAGANVRSGLKRSNTFGSVDSDEEVEAELLRVNGKAGRAKSPSQPKSTHPAASTAPAVGKGPTAAVSTTDLNAHLRLTHKILYHILEKHNALPDKNAPLLLRRGPNTVPVTKAAKPSADTPAPAAATEPQQTSTTPFQDTSELDGYQDANKMLNFNYYNESPPPPPPAQQMSRSAIRGSLYARRVSHSLTPAEQAMQTAQLQHQQQVQFSRRQSGGNGTFQTPEGGTAQQREAYRRASHTVSSPADMTNVYVTMSPQASNTLAQHTVNGYQMRRGSNMTSGAVVSGGHYGGNNSGGEDNGNGRTPTNNNQQHHGSNTKRTPVHSGRNTSLTSPNGTTPQRNSFASPTDLSSIVKNTVRNGIPVTTVNLGYSSGIKTARSEISTPNNANAGPKTPVKHQ